MLLMTMESSLFLCFAGETGNNKCRLPRYTITIVMPQFLYHRLTKTIKRTIERSNSSSAWYFQKNLRSWLFYCRSSLLFKLQRSQFVNALQKAAGVQINANSGSMGGSTKVVIEEISLLPVAIMHYLLWMVYLWAIQAPTPLVQNGGGGFTTSPIQDKPDDIDQISVLKELQLHFMAAEVLMALC